PLHRRRRRVQQARALLPDQPHCALPAPRRAARDLRGARGCRGAARGEVLNRARPALRAAALLALALLAGGAAEAPTPLLRARVPDLAGLLPPADAARLEAKLAAFERETSHQIAVLTVPSLGGEPIETFAHRAAEQARLGQQGVDNGILLVIAVQDRRARVEGGYGLEGAVPAAIAKRIV